MHKVLMLASVASMIDQFNMDNISILKKQGYEVHVAANFEDGNTTSKQRINEFKKELEELNIIYHQIDLSRKVINFKKNIIAYKQIKKLMKHNNYEFVHCHSPIGGVFGRIAARATKTKVIYTAHGFHFFKGAPLINWIIYYPIEWICSIFTDILITMNKEDYDLAKKKMKCNKVEYVEGIGIDTKKPNQINVDKKCKRKELGIPEDSIMLLSVGELSKRKNHEVIIRALAKMNNKKIYYVICGQGSLIKELKRLCIELGIDNQVLFAGFRKDILEVCKIADIFCFPSLQEGLPVALMEAMSCSVPVVCSKIRGNVDLIEDGKGGYSYKPTDINGFVQGIKMIINNEELYQNIVEYNLKKIKRYDKNKIKSDMSRIYMDLLRG